MLQLKKVNKSFSDQKVLDAIDLEIEDQEFVVLVGPSGSGKSTLLRIIAGLEEQDSGEIVFAGSNIEVLEPKDRNLAMVFQNYALYPHKTVFENIAFPLDIQNCPKQEIETKVNGIASKLDIDELLERKPGQLSGGQRQRVALARAMAKDPKLFLFDEPLSNLDAKLRGQMRQEIFAIRKNSSSTFVYVTHDQVEALTLGDRIAVLNDGKLQQFDSPENIYHHPANTFVASFIGSPATNLLELKNYPDKIVGIRPEFLSLEKAEQELKVELHNIESLGNEYLLYASLEEDSSQSLVAKIQNSKQMQDLYKKFDRSNMSISLFFDNDLLYYFNRLNGEKL